MIRNTGPSLSPFNAWVLLKRLEARQSDTQARANLSGTHRGPPWLDARQVRRYAVLCSEVGEMARARASARTPFTAAVGAR